MFVNFVIFFVSFVILAFFLFHVIFSDDFVFENVEDDIRLLMSLIFAAVLSVFITAYNFYYCRITYRENLYKVEVKNDDYILYKTTDNGYVYFSEFDSEDVEVCFLKSGCEPYVEYNKVLFLDFYLNPVLYIPENYMPQNVLTDVN